MFNSLNSQSSVLKTTGAFLIFIGVVLGIAYSSLQTAGFIIVSHLSLFGIFPIGLCLLIVGVYMLNEGSLKILSLKVVSFVMLLDVIFYVGLQSYSNYAGEIIIVLWIIFIKHLNKCYKLERRF